MRRSIGSVCDESDELDPEQAEERGEKQKATQQQEEEEKGEDERESRNKHDCEADDPSENE